MQALSTQQIADLRAIVLRTQGYLEAQVKLSQTERMREISQELIDQLQAKVLNVVDI